MRDREQVASAVRDLLAQVMDLSPAAVGPGFDQARCDAWTSLAHLMLISQLEAHFGVLFSGKEIPSLTGFDQIVDAIVRRPA